MRGLVLLGALAAAALCGCGAQGVEDALTLDEVAAATGSDTYRFEYSLRDEDLNESSSSSANGAVDPVGQRASFRYVVGELTSEVRQLGNVTYTRFSGPDLDAGWTKEPTADNNQIPGPLAYVFAEPHRMADALARHGRDVEAVPGEDIDGVATTRYRVTIATIELLGMGLAEKQREELETEILKSGSETATVEAWAGVDGVLRRVHFTAPVIEGGKRGRIVSSTRFFGFGEPVEVSAPPESEVLTLPPEVVGDVAGPCRGEAAPHSPAKVAAAFRKAGFTVTVGCQAGDTRIAALPAGEGEGIYCGISSEATDPPNVPPHSLVEGNVSCWGPESDEQLAALRTLLDGL